MSFGTRPVAAAGGEFQIGLHSWDCRGAFVLQSLPCAWIRPTVSIGSTVTTDVDGSCSCGPFRYDLNELIAWAKAHQPEPLADERTHRPAS